MDSFFKYHSHLAGFFYLCGDRRILLSIAAAFRIPEDRPYRVPVIRFTAAGMILGAWPRYGHQHDCVRQPGRAMVAGESFSIRCSQPNFFWTNARESHRPFGTVASTLNQAETNA